MKMPPNNKNVSNRYHRGYTRKDLWDPHNDSSLTLEYIWKQREKESEELRKKKEAMTVAERLKKEMAYKRALKKLWLYRLVSFLIVLLIGLPLLLTAPEFISWNTVFFVVSTYPLIDSLLRTIDEQDFYR